MTGIAPCSSENRDGVPNKKTEEVARLNEQRQRELEKISGLTTDQAKEMLLESVKDDIKRDTAIFIKTMENEAREEADRFRAEASEAEKAAEEAKGRAGRMENAGLLARIFRSW